MNKKIPKYLKLTFAASILGTSLLTGFPTNTYAEDTLTVLDVNATQNGWSLQDGTWYYYKKRYSVNEYLDYIRRSILLFGRRWVYADEYLDW